MKCWAAKGFEPGDIHLQHELELHHPGQLWTVRAPVPHGRMDAAAVRVAFESEYSRLYGHVQPNGVIMVASLRLTARGSTGDVMVAGGARATATADADGGAFSLARRAGLAGDAGV